MSDQDNPCVGEECVNRLNTKITILQNQISRMDTGLEKTDKTMHDVINACTKLETIIEATDRRVDKLDSELDRQKSETLAFKHHIEATIDKIYRRVERSEEHIESKLEDTLGKYEHRMDQKFTAITESIKMLANKIEPLSKFRWISLGALLLLVIFVSELGIDKAVKFLF